MKMKRIIILIGYSIIGVSLMASENSNTLTKTTDSKSASTVRMLDDSIKKYSRENNDTAIWLLVQKGGKEYRASAGLANREYNITAKKDQLFEIGSASKVLTGIAIFQLIEQGKLSLDTKLNTFYRDTEIKKLANIKDKNYWDSVTVGMLLRHRSGFVDYLNVYHDDMKTINLLGGKDKHYTFEQLIHMAVAHGDANFKPNEKFQYCNTGYIILGDIITKVSGMDWHDYIQKNVIDRAQMKHTYFSSRIPKQVREKMPRGYANGKLTFMPASLADSAGEVISNTKDLSKLIKAWGKGKLYKNPKTLKFQMSNGLQHESPSISNLLYGYAIMDVEDFYGHGGQTFGFESYIAYNPKKDEVYIVGTNDAFVHSMDLFLQVAGISLK